MLTLPSTAAVKKLGVKSIIAGVSGGVDVSLGTAIFGSVLGDPRGAIVATAAISGDAEELVAIKDTMGGMITLFMGVSSRSVGTM